jgi:hypothetical protein
MDVSTKLLMFAVNAALVASLVTGCSSSMDEPSVALRDSAGVHIAENAAADFDLNWTPREVFRIGGTDSGPAAFSYVDEKGIAVDKSGHVVVLDRTEATVHMFDGEGRHLRSFARRGSGPGELREPYTLSINAQGLISVFDRGNLALVQFDTMGRSAGQLRLPSLIVVGSQSPVEVGRGLIAVGSDSLENSSEITTGTVAWRRLLHWRTWEGTPYTLAQMRVEQPKFTPVGPANCPMKIMTPPIFWPEPTWFVAEDYVLHTSETEYRLHQNRTG